MSGSDSEEHREENPEVGSVTNVDAVMKQPRTAQIEHRNGFENNVGCLKAQRNALEAECSSLDPKHRRLQEIANKLVFGLDHLAMLARPMERHQKLTLALHLCHLDRRPCC